MLAKHKAARESIRNMSDAAERERLTRALERTEVNLKKHADYKDGDL